MDNILAIIPARGGSKGIIKKNIRILDQKPLIFYQIQAALESKYISKVYVSTDDNEIVNIVKQYHNVEVIKRPLDISEDKSKSEEALIHAVNHLENLGQNIDIIVFLQATSPLNKPEYIDKAIEKIQEGYDSVCCAVEDYGFFLNTEEIIERPMRQNKIPKIRECGNFWVVKKNILIKYNNRLGGKVGYILIDKLDALEIDEAEDLIIIRSILERNNRIKNNNYYKKRVLEEPINFEEEYWGITIDPDGNERDKLNEKKLFIENAKDVINYINKLKPAKILDVGCGFGFLLSAINNEWKKHGTELSEYSSNIASQYADIFIGDLLSSNFKPSSFDVITLYHVIEHLKDPISYINKIYELLKITGKLIISTPDFESIMAKRYKDKFRLLHDKTHISLFSTNSLVNLLKDNGFEIENIEYPYFDTPYFTKENLLKLFDNENMSPPFYGNVVNVYAYKS